ncbi:hypothetical protein AB0C07_07115 [Actinoplanes missouriensis]|uniref:hypothetical protein n=1 Tax=Actinoplanes missouriensis TaxID=1866 RepID=UPI00340CCD4E
MKEESGMNEDEYGTLLLRPLDTEPDATGRIDVAKAMRNGLRARRVRTWSTGAAVTTGLAVAVTSGILVLRPHPEALPPPLPADPGVPAACTAAELPLGTATSAAVNGGDPTGSVLVGETEPVAGGDGDVLVWRDGKLAEHVTYTGPRVSMGDINTAGIAVGATTEGTVMPYVLHDGTVTRLKGTGNAAAINEAGLIAGDAETNQGEGVPQRWASWTAEPEAMPMPPGYTAGTAWDVTEDGTIITSLYGGDLNGMFLWHRDGTVEAVRSPQPEKGDQKVYVEPRAYHYGWIYAEVRMLLEPSTRQSPAALNPRMFRYDPSSRTWEKLLDEVTAAQIPGPHRKADWFIQGEPAVYVGKQVMALPRLEKYPDDSFGVAFISENARIAAGSNLSGIAAERPVQPIIWRCR